MPPAGRISRPGRLRRPVAPRDRTACASFAVSRSWLVELDRPAGQQRPVAGRAIAVVGGGRLDDVAQDEVGRRRRIAPADHRQDFAMLVDLAPLKVGDVVTFMSSILETLM